MGEGVKAVLRKLATRGRMEESMAEDLADSLTKDSLVGIYFLLGLFHADNIKSLFTNTAKFARMGNVLLGPFGWIRGKINDLLSFDYVNPWWLSSPMPAVRRAFAGHWMSFSIFGFQPFLFLRRNSRRAAAAGIVALSGMLIWKFRPGPGIDSCKPPMVCGTRGQIMWRKRIMSLRREEAKSLAKGRGKNKGRAQAVRAMGARARRVKATRAGGGNRSGRNNRNMTVSSDLHWYDDDRVKVYDPMREREMEMILGSKEFKELYNRVRAAGMAEQAMIHNARTDEVTDFYGNLGGPSLGDDYPDNDDDYYDVYDDDESNYERDEESTGFYRSRVVTYGDIFSKDLFSTTVSVGCTIEEENAGYDESKRSEESSLGRDRLVLSKLKGGVAVNGDDSISVVVISGRMILMKHFIEQVKGKTFKVIIGGAEFSVDKTEGCPLGDGGELLTYAQPRGLQGFRSSKLSMGVPTNGLNGAEVCLVRFGDDGPSEISVGKWHDGSYSAFSQPGWCGSIVMVFPPKGPPIMVGVHRWGVGSDGLNECEILDKSSVQYFKRNPPHPSE